MTTKVFISWSGDLSRQLAEEVRNWLPGVLQYVKPYFTPDDIEKGAKWSTEILKELEESEIGILCLTRDNLDKPWILFEAGALSKNFGKSKVCTILFGIDSSDLSGPLTGFQDTKFNKVDFKKLIESINKEGGDSKLDSKILDKVFDMWWDRLENSVNRIMEGNSDSEEAPARPDRELLEEILELTRLKSSQTIQQSPIIPRPLLRRISVTIEELIDITMRHSDQKTMMLTHRLCEYIRSLFIELDVPARYIRATSGFSQKIQHKFFEDSEIKQDNETEE